MSDVDVATGSSGSGHPTGWPTSARPSTTRAARSARSPAHPDEESLVVARGESTYVVLNLHPYNPGHLMVLPYRHVADLTDLTEPESTELMAMTQRSLRAIRAVSRPHSFNVGLNLGRSAGGSLADHLHQHVVPRGGPVTPTSSPSSAAPRCCRSCSRTPATCSPPPDGGLGDERRSADRVGVLRLPALEGQDRGVADPAVPDLDRPRDASRCVPGLRARPAPCPRTAAAPRCSPTWPSSRGTTGCGRPRSSGHGRRR